MSIVVALGALSFYFDNKDLSCDYSLFSCDPVILNSFKLEPFNELTKHVQCVAVLEYII